MVCSFHEEDCTCGEEGEDLHRRVLKEQAERSVRVNHGFVTSKVVICDFITSDFEMIS